MERHRERQCSNDTSATRIMQAYVNQVGPLGDSVMAVNLANNWFSYSSVIHHEDYAFVKYTGGWVPKVISGFWDLFTYCIIEATATAASAITFSIPIQTSGTYLLS